MNPSEQEPDDVNPIADQNTERLLAGAYRPETPDPAFLARVTAVMHAAAAECVESARPAPASRSRLPVKRWIGWVAAAGLLFALGAVAGVVGRAGPFSSAGRNRLDQWQGISGSRCDTQGAVRQVEGTGGSP